MSCISCLAVQGSGIIPGNRRETTVVAVCVVSEGFWLRFLAWFEELRSSSHHNCPCKWRSMPREEKGPTSVRSSAVIELTFSGVVRSAGV